MKNILSDVAGILHLLGCIRHATGPVMDPYTRQAIETTQRVWEALMDASLVDVTVEVKGEKVR
jgi:hypothetical protein